MDSAMNEIDVNTVCHVGDELMIYVTLQTNDGTIESYQQLLVCVCVVCVCVWLCVCVVCGVCVCVVCVCVCVCALVSAETCLNVLLSEK